MICLNVGCNDIQLADFINIDLNHSVKPDLVWDATKLRDKFQDDSVDFIYCGHFLEHFNAATAQAIIKDFHYLLRPYGCAVAVVPDYTKVDKLDVASAERIIMAEGTHKILFNESRLHDYFYNGGFTTFPVDVRLLPWCRFPQVSWQSTIIAMKHPKVTFTTG
jgi:predicted SAM-dependent methyltransferase